MSDRPLATNQIIRDFIHKIEGPPDITSHIRTALLDLFDSIVEN